jgi:hypothetical protein
MPPNSAGLRAVSLVNEAKALEAYFIRHGASWQMMSALFKIRRKVTLRRRRDCGAWRPSGRFRFPIPRCASAFTGHGWPSRIRSRGCATTACIRHFPKLSLAVLEAVARGFEEEP